MVEQDDQLHELVEKLNKSERSNLRWVGVVSLMLITASIVGLAIYVRSANNANARLVFKNKLANVNNEIASKELNAVSDRLGRLQRVTRPDVEGVQFDLKNTQASLDQNNEGEKIISSFDQIRLDIFYCTDNAGKLKRLADDLAETKPSSFVDWDWRVRPISNETNAQTGYQSQANEIRYEDGEDFFAVWLKERYEAVFGVSLAYRKIAPQSADYVSVFFCDVASVPT